MIKVTKAVQVLIALPLTLKQYAFNYVIEANSISEVDLFSNGIPDTPNTEYKLQQSRDEEL